MSKCNLPHPKQPRLCDEVHQVILPHPRRTEVGRVSVTGALLVTDHIYAIVAGWYGQRHVPFLEIVSYHTAVGLRPVAYKPGRHTHLVSLLLCSLSLQFEEFMIYNYLVRKFIADGVISECTKLSFICVHITLPITSHFQYEFIVI